MSEDLTRAELLQIRILTNISRFLAGAARWLNRPAVSLRARAERIEFRDEDPF